jgi:hypothetical protein
MDGRPACMRAVLHLWATSEGTGDKKKKKKTTTTTKKELCIVSK